LAEGGRDPPHAGPARGPRAPRQTRDGPTRLCAPTSTAPPPADRDPRIIDATATFLAMIGSSREALPLASDALTPPEWRERTGEARREFMDRGVASPFEKEYLRKDGSRVPVLVGAAALPEAPDQALAFVVDLTAERKAQ